MNIKRTIRKLDQELYNQARVQALKEGKPIGEWINELIRLRFSKIKRVGNAANIGRSITKESYDG